MQHEVTTLILYFIITHCITYGEVQLALFIVKALTTAQMWSEFNFPKRRLL